MEKGIGLVDVHILASAQLLGITYKNILNEGANYHEKINDACNDRNRCHVSVYPLFTRHCR